MVESRGPYLDLGDRRREQKLGDGMKRHFKNKENTDGWYQEQKLRSQKWTKMFLLMVEVCNGVIGLRQAPAPVRSL